MLNQLTRTQKELWLAYVTATTFLYLFGVFVAWDWGWISEMSEWGVGARTLLGCAIIPVYGMIAACVYDTDY